MPDTPETFPMRLAALLAASLTLSLPMLAPAVEPARLVLTDEELSIQELRPLERHVWVLTLEGKWSDPSQPGVKHYVNVFFPNGAVASHRVLSEDLTRK